MLLKGRTCLDIAQQLQAVEKAVQQAKKVLIKDHMDHCLTRLVGLLTAETAHSEIVQRHDTLFVALVVCVFVQPRCVI